jgi:hypothetical protein
MSGGTDKLGIYSPYLSLGRHFSVAPTQLCCAGNTMFHRQRAQQPKLGRPRMRSTVDVSSLDHAQLQTDMSGTYSERSNSISTLSAHQLYRVPMSRRVVKRETHFAPVPKRPEEPSGILAILTSTLSIYLPCSN